MEIHYFPDNTFNAVGRFETGPKNRVNPIDCVLTWGALMGTLTDIEVWVFDGSEGGYRVDEAAVTLLEKQDGFHVVSRNYNGRKWLVKGRYEGDPGGPHALLTARSYPVIA